MREWPYLLQSAPLALVLWAGLASAQTTGVVVGLVTDAITGEPLPGAQVTATSPALPGSQTAVADAAGTFRLMLLPPGQYQLQAAREGYRTAARDDVAVRLDATLRANLELLPEVVEMEEQVIPTGVAPVIDVSSAESGMVVTPEAMKLLPLGRSIQEVEALAPTARRDKFGFGFAGAQSPENAYLIDGLNVTDPRFGSLGSDFLPNFFEQVDVKTGAYMPEYGRSTAGVVNAVLKSGSNELHGSAWANLTPRFLLEPEGHATGRSGEAVWIRSTPGHGGLSGGAGDLDAGFELGGPIEQDKLWFYVGFAPVLQRTVVDRYLRWTESAKDANGNPVQHDIARTDRYYGTTSKQFQSVAKLTWLVDPNHDLSLSALWAPRSVQGFDGSTLSDPANGRPSTFLSDRWSETIDAVTRYSGKLLDRHLILEAQAGIHYQFSEDRPGVVNGVNQATTPGIRWGVPLPLSSFEQVPAECAPGGACDVNRYLTGGQPAIEKYFTRRWEGRLSASYLFQAAGTHDLKGGLDLEVNDYHEHYRYPGGAGFLFRGNGRFLLDSFGTVDGDGVPEFWDGVHTRSRSINQAYYLQDSWQIPNSGLTLNYGLRWELQHLENTQPLRQSQLAAGDSPQAISIDDNLAPRLQAIYDFTGQGRGKIAASWGRFYQSIPLYLADRAFGGVSNIQGAYQCAGGWQNNPTFDPRTAPGCTAVGFGQANGVSSVAPDLKGMYVDQFGLAAEYELISDLSVGIEWQARRLGRAIDDLSSDDGYTFFIANPGESRPWTYNGQVKDPRQVTSIDPATGRPYTVSFPKPQRDYDGLTFKVTKSFSNDWLAQASYTYSVLRGNYAGVFRPEKGLPTPTPNLTTDYDAPSLMQNRTGLLPGDVTHQLKLFGAYVFHLTPQLNLTAGGAFSAQSGTPLSALGYHPLGGRSESYIIPRGEAGRTPPLTQVDLKGQLEYVIAPPYVLKLTLEIFNLFNSQAATELDQNYTYDQVQPIVNAPCNSRSGANAANPIAGLQAACPDLKHLKTVDGRPVTVNGNYGHPLGSPDSFQLPISVRVGAALTF